MTTLTTRKPRTQDLDDLATEINAAHAACGSALRTGLDHALRCGDAMIAAKSQIIHGAWLGWLERHCPNISTRQAQGYMRLARNRNALEANTKPVSHLGVREALALLADPNPVDGPLPDAGHELYGYLDDGRIVHLIAAKNPEFCFYGIIDDDLTAMTFGKRCIRRDAIHGRVLPLEITGYDPSQVLWDDQQPCETPTGIYYPDFVPDWQQPGWAERRKAEIDAARAEGRLDEVFGVEVDGLIGGAA